MKQKPKNLMKIELKSIGKYRNSQHTSEQKDTVPSVRCQWCSGVPRCCPETPNMVAA